MKKIIYTLFVFLTCQIYACENPNSSLDEWFNHWVNGMNLMHNRNYAEASTEFSQAIKIIELKETLNSNNIHLYNDRGQALLLTKHYVEAISDFTFVLESQDVPINQTIRALWGRTTSYAAIDDSENFKIDYEKLKSTDPDYPKVEYTKDFVIFRNFDTSALTLNAKNRFCCAMIHLDICSSKEDILFTNTGVCLVKRKCQCGCENSRKQNEFEKIHGKGCDCCGEIIQISPSGAIRNAGDCKYWCDRVAQTAFVMCGTAFKALPCKLMCTGVVEAVKEGCHWCCYSGDFYRKCVKPFEEFLQQVPCDPQFD